jgi:hypothetical protein
VVAQLGVGFAVGGQAVQQQRGEAAQRADSRIRDGRHRWASAPATMCAGLPDGEGDWNVASMTVKLQGRVGGFSGWLAAIRVNGRLAG